MCVVIATVIAVSARVNALRAIPKALDLGPTSRTIHQVMVTVVPISSCPDFDAVTEAELLDLVSARRQARSACIIAIFSTPNSHRAGLISLTAGEDIGILTQLRLKSILFAFFPRYW
jgi:hypothetical protein